MAEDRQELHRIHWEETLPFVRLFTTVGRAMDLHHLSLALVCVAAAYVAGRILDSIWSSAGGGVLVSVAPGGPGSEIEAFARLDGAGYRQWRETTRQDAERFEARCMERFGGPGAQADAKRSTASVRSVIETAEHARELREVRDWLDRKERDALASIARDTTLPAEARRRQSHELRRSADYVRFLLARKRVDRFSMEEAAVAVPTLLAAAPDPDAGRQSEARARLERVVERQQALLTLDARAPGGIFLSQLEFQMRCFSAAVRGVAAGRWGFSGGALDSEPSLGGSLATSGSGLLWLVTQRPGYAIVYGLLHLVIFGYFGMAICRSAAVQWARGETPTTRDALRFAREKFFGCLFEAGFPVAIFVGVALLLVIGGLIGAIPIVGEFLFGLGYVLALLGALALVFAVVGLILGLHLMLPTVAVEGSDFFDAVQHAFGYVLQRGWNLAFYTLSLLLYGGLAFVVYRVLAMLVLKTAHAVTGAGMSWFGAWSSARTSTLSKLDAIWRMPAWNEMSLLPATGGLPFWGDFGHAPLSSGEMVASFFVEFWVFLVVALLGAFVVSFYFCGSTAMYFLLRRDIDGVDYNEVYYEEDAEAAGGESTTPPSNAGSDKGTPLPVIGSQPGGGPAAG